jgi:hypothetical protein
MLPTVSNRFLSSLALGVIAAWLSVMCGSLATAQQGPASASSQVLAQAIDAQLRAEVPTDANSAAGRTDDEAFLRRASQDLIGELPTPVEITAFALDPAADKRERAVERLLADPRYGENWARYFRDMILFRRTDDRSLITRTSVTKFLTEQLNQGAGWDAIAKSFITATGDVRENGNTALIMAQMGQAVDIAAETARIFLGIQIQCAQCHDHKTDRWTREQFHELAAFFPRVTVRPVREGEKRVSFAINSRDGAARPVKKPGGRGGSAEHFMPDLQDPSVPGTQMTPVFFVSGQKLELGTKDADRRQQLADWITAPSNPWFARAFVNRMWAELVGHGFYEPVDDLGPDRTPTAPQTMELLSQEFASHHYDVKWLLRTIMATEAYQRASRSSSETGPTTFAANCPQPLRADQVFSALAAALAIDESQFNPPGGPQGPAAQRFARGPRAEFERTFGYDPSAPRDEIAASIPQALLMMNSPILNRAISGKNPNTVLGKLLAENADDETIATELYLRCLAREPEGVELATCLSYVSASPNRAEAFEDILWALVNSTEFTRRK